jgi:hypothetical protein
MGVELPAPKCPLVNAELTLIGDRRLYRTRRRVLSPPPSLKRASDRGPPTIVPSRSASRIWFWLRTPGKETRRLVATCGKLGGATGIEPPHFANQESGFA